MTRTSYIAPAKINLGLEIVRKRDDGYHDLNTVFYRVLEPHDSITVTPSDVFRLTCSDSALPSDARNLMVQAAHGYAEVSKSQLPPIHVHLDKRIPTAAGLGGGSSDAATMIEIMRDHSPATLSGAQLNQIAVRIGADVPFFLLGSLAASARGIGEVLAPINLELQQSILIVKDPLISVSTKDAYASLQLTEEPVHDYNALFEAGLDMGELRSELRNDFERSVFERYPRLREIKQELYDRGADFALMSGSGSALFALFASVDTAREASLQCESEGLLTFVNEGRSS